MTPKEYAALRDDAIRRAHVLRQEAMHAFWDALLRRLAFTSKVKPIKPLRPGIRM